MWEIAAAKITISWLLYIITETKALLKEKVNVCLFGNTEGKPVPVTKKEDFALAQEKGILFSRGWCALAIDLWCYYTSAPKAKS